MALKHTFDQADNDDPDLLENCGILKLQVHRLRYWGFTRLSQFDGKSDIDILREPNTNLRTVREIREAQARRQNSFKEKIK